MTLKRYFHDMNIALICLILCGIICSFLGYHYGVLQATTSNGWIEGDRFVLEVDGHLYEWDIDEP